MERNTKQNLRRERSLGGLQEFLNGLSDIYLPGLPERLGHSLVFLGYLIHELLVLLFPLSHVGNLEDIGCDPSSHG